MFRSIVDFVGPSGLVAMDFEGRSAILEVEWPQPRVGDVVQAAKLNSGFLSLRNETRSTESKARVVAFHPSAMYVFDLLSEEEG